MNPFTNKPALKALARGRILTVLYYAAMGETLNPDDPNTMSKGVLVAALEQLRERPADSELHTTLRYLEEKQYLEVEWSKDGSGSFESIRLRTDGIDVVEGTSEDKAVFIPARR
jgi:hypothetical protein